MEDVTWIYDDYVQMNPQELATEKVIVRHQAIKEFEAMKDMAELKALSNYSLENPLNEEQFKRIMELKNKVWGV